MHQWERAGPSRPCLTLARRPRQAMRRPLWALRGAACSPSCPARGWVGGWVAGRGSIRAGQLLASCDSPGQCSKAAFRWTEEKEEVAAGKIHILLMTFPRSFIGPELDLNEGLVTDAACIPSCQCNADGRPVGARRRHRPRRPRAAALLRRAGPRVRPERHGAADGAGVASGVGPCVCCRRLRTAQHETLFNLR